MGSDNEEVRRAVQAVGRVVRGHSSPKLLVANRIAAGLARQEYLSHIRSHLAEQPPTQLGGLLLLNSQIRWSCRRGDITSPVTVQCSAIRPDPGWVVSGSALIGDVCGRRVDVLIPDGCNTFCCRLRCGDFILDVC